MPKPPSYGIIYNWDGAPHEYSVYPQQMNDFLAKMYAPMENTQVGAHFWCVGADHATWKSKVIERLGDQGYYGEAYGYNTAENAVAMFDRGEDPFAAAINRGHELGIAVYASVRMNDNHHGGAQPQDMPSMDKSGVTKIRRDHPEWLLGKDTYDWFALSWNMSIPEVREYRYKHVEEVCRLWEWDGIELDWQRHAFHLPDDYGYRLRYALTDLQRAIRRLTDELANKRGRPFYLAARVASSLEMCRRTGYDLPTWIDEGLVDIIIPAANAATDPDIDVAAYKELCKGTDIVVYPGFDGGLPDPFVGPEDNKTKNILRTRAIASRYHKNGADGIYVFNWHANKESRRDLLTSIGSAKTLRKKDKIYTATHRFIHKQGEWRWAYHNDRLLGQVPVPLKRTLTGDGPTIPIQVADNFKIDIPESLELRVRLEQWVNGDIVHVSWDDKELRNAQVNYSDNIGNLNISDFSSAVWLRFALTPDQANEGEHNVKVVLEKHNPKVRHDIVVSDVELVVKFPQGKRKA